MSQEKHTKKEKMPKTKRQSEFPSIIEITNAEAKWVKEIYLHPKILEKNLEEINKGKSVTERQQKFREWMKKYGLIKIEEFYAKATIDPSIQLEMNEIAANLGKWIEQHRETLLASAPELTRITQKYAPLLKELNLEINIPTIHSSFEMMRTTSGTNKLIEFKTRGLAFANVDELTEYLKNRFPKTFEGRDSREIADIMVNNKPLPPNKPIKPSDTLSVIFKAKESRHIPLRF